MVDFTTIPSFVEPSPLDEARFGIRTVRVSDAWDGNIEALGEFCSSNGVRLAIVRCSSDRTELIHRLEGARFLLMDTLLTWSCALPFDRLPVRFGGEIREAMEADLLAIEAIARSAFKGYPGHYHADKRLDREACNELYVDWTRRSCRSREIADEVLVAINGGRVAGFMTIRVRSSEGEAVLGGVAEDFRGRGVYRALLEECRSWLSARDGLSRMLVRTQMENIAVQKAWCRLGFLPLQSHHTFHRWFDE